MVFSEFSILTDEVKNKEGSHNVNMTLYWSLQRNPFSRAPFLQRGQRSEVRVNYKAALLEVEHVQVHLCTRVFSLHNSLLEKKQDAVCNEESWK